MSSLESENTKEETKRHLNMILVKNNIQQDIRADRSGVFVSGPASNRNMNKKQIRKTEKMCFTSHRETETNMRTNLDFRGLGQVLVQTWSWSYVKSWWDPDVVLDDITAVVSGVSQILQAQVTDPTTPGPGQDLESEPDRTQVTPPGPGLDPSDQDILRPSQNQKQ